MIHAYVIDTVYIECRTCGRVCTLDVHIHQVYIERSMEQRSRLLENMSKSCNGAAWLSLMSEECIGGLIYIEGKLSHMWDSGTCFPSIERVMLPFHIIHPSNTKLMMICKEPYRSNDMATGIPVDTGNGLETGSCRIFSKLISEYWRNVNKGNFMQCYYASGILVINACFTSCSIPDRRYKLSHSHGPLWTWFLHPMIRIISDIGIPILAMGTEARALTRNMSNSHSLYYCSFPTEEDSRSCSEYFTTMRMLMWKYMFTK